MRSRIRSLLPAAVCLVLVLGWSVLMVRGIVLRRDVFHWDESAYAFKALLLSDDLRRGDLATFAGRSTSSEFMTYGFLQAYVVAPFFAVLGPSIALARIVSVALMAGTALMVFTLCSTLERRAGAFAGLLAVVVLLSSPEMINWHTSNMLEPLAVFLTAVIVTVYVLARGSGRAWPHALVGLLLAALFFAKHNYGTLAMAGLAVDACVSLGLAVGRRQRVALMREVWSYLLLACSAALPLLIWVRAASVPRVFDTLQWELVDQWVGIDVGHSSYGERLVSLLRVLTDFFFASPAFGWYALLALVLSLVLVRDRRLRALALVTVTSLVLIPTSPLVQARYVLAAVPPLVALGTIVPLRALRQGRLTAIASVLLLVGSAIGVAASWATIANLPPRVAAVVAIETAAGYVWRDPSGDSGAVNLIDVVEFVRGKVPRQHSVATMVRMGFLSPYLWKLEFHDWDAPVWTSNEFDDPQMQAAEYFVALDFGDAYPYQIDLRAENRSTNSKLWSAYLAARSLEGSVVLDAERSFPSIGTRVLIYRNSGTTRIPLPAFVPPMKL